ncbi:RecB family exonuclease [soil metagenome]
MPERALSTVPVTVTRGAYHRAMVIELPRTLSPSKVSSFTDCALAFRFAAIDRLPEPPSVAATKGTLVHRALELLYTEPAEGRTRAAAAAMFERAAHDIRTDADFTELALDPEAEVAFFAEAAQLVQRYFDLEDPRTIEPIGIELRLEAEVGGVTLRGVIDRLELDADGELVVTDYKTGREPAERFEQGRLGGVHFYALLCERLFGKRPARVQLLYLADPVAIICTPSPQSSRAIERKVGAIWTAVERACLHDDFRPRPSKLCNWCAFKVWCPAFGGDPAAGRRSGQDRLAAVATTDDVTSAGVVAVPA